MLKKSPSKDNYRSSAAVASIRTSIEAAKAEAHKKKYKDIDTVVLEEL